MRPFQKVARFGRCVICKRRPADGLVPIHGYPRGFSVDPIPREEPWCRPCAEAVLEYNQGPGDTVWCMAGGGIGNWLPANRIPV